MADEYELPGLFPQLLEQQRQRQPIVPPDQLAAARSEADSYFSKLQETPTTPLPQLIAAALGASLPAIIGGFSGGIEQAGYAGPGMGAAMTSFMDRQDDLHKRQQRTAEIGYEKRQRMYDTLLDLSVKDKASRDSDMQDVLLAGAKEQGEISRADATRANQIQLQRMQDETELEKTRITNPPVSEELANEIAKLSGGKYLVEPGASKQAAEAALQVIQAKGAATRDEVDRLRLEYDIEKTEWERSPQGQEQALAKIRAQGEETRKNATLRDQLGNLTPEETRAIELARQGQPVPDELIDKMKDPKALALLAKTSRDFKIGVQGDTKLAQGERGLDLKEKFGDANIADKVVGRSIQQQQLELQKQKAVWGQSFQMQREERMKEAQVQGYALQKQRLVAQQNAMMLKSKAFDMQVATPEQIAAEKASLAASGASPEMLATLDFQTSKQGLGFAVGEIRRRMGQAAQINGETKKPLPSKAIDAVADSRRMTEVLSSAYEALSELKKLNKGSPYATYTAQKMQEDLPLTKRGLLKDWLFFDGMQMLYTLSGKQINETEAKMFTDFFSGASAMALGDIEKRFDELAEAGYAKTLTHLEGAYLYEGTRGPAKEMAKKLALKAKPAQAAKMMQAAPELFTAGDE